MSCAYNHERSSPKYLKRISEFLVLRRRPGTERMISKVVLIVMVRHGIQEYYHHDGDHWKINQVILELGNW
jgi:hypothetical protein